MYGEWGHYTPSSGGRVKGQLWKDVPRRTWHVVPATR
jgi:hypothetical protein